MENLEMEQLELEEEQNVDVNEEVETTEEVEEELTLMDLLAKDESMKKEFDSMIDTRVTSAIKTREKKHQEELKRQERRAQMTTEELLKEKELELAEREEQLKAYELRNKKVDYFKQNSLNLDLVDFVHAQNDEEIEEKTQLLLSVINNEVSKRVKEQLGSNGYSLEEDGKEDITPFSLEDFEGMSPEEINKHFNKLI